LWIGSLKVRAPRVHDKRPEQKFASSILPPYMRKTPRLEEAVLVLCLRGLSTGPLDQRHMWLEIQVRDAAGTSIYHNGWFDAQTGQIDPKTALYVKILEDAAGRRITEHILFDVQELCYTRAPIPAGGSDTISYASEIPAMAQGPLTVEVKLWYWLVLQEIITLSLGLDLIVPPVIMAQ